GPGGRPTDTREVSRIDLSERRQVKTSFVQRLPSTRYPTKNTKNGVRVMPQARISSCSSDPDAGTFHRSVPCVSDTPYGMKQGRGHSFFPHLRTTTSGT